MFTSINSDKYQVDYLIKLHVIYIYFFFLKEKSLNDAVNMGSRKLVLLLRVKINKPNIMLFFL